MSASLAPIADFLSTVAPFQALDDETRASLSRLLEIEYQRRGTVLREPGTEADRFYLVRTGALTETDESAVLVSRYAEGEIAGLEELLSREPSRTTLRTSEDCILYGLRRERFERFLAEHPEWGRSLSASVGERLRQASFELARTEPSLGNTTSPVHSLLTRSLVSVDARTTILEAARLMRDLRVSALVVTGAANLGILTDRDLRNRVVAEGHNPADPVRSVMSSPTVTIDESAPIFDALVLMLEKSIHHLVVTHNDHPVGVVTTTDLVRAHSEHAIFVVGDINKQTSLDGVVRAHRQRHRVLSRLVLAGARAVDIHRVLSGIADTAMRRVIHLAENELFKQGIGEMPPHCWVVFGSLARNEVSIGSDQDNGLILGPGTPPHDPAARFVSEWVSEGLEACGYPKCKGEIMASTDRFRQPAAVWRNYFSKWILTPEKSAIMHASIFFDSRSIAGDRGLLDPLQEWIGSEVAKNPVFIAHMAKDAMARRPPLGLFRQFVVETSGENVDSLDLKHKGLIPIVDLARVLSLEAGYTLPGTLERLKAAQAKGKLSSTGCSELSSAYEYIALLRLRHQARALARGQPSSSYVDPNELSSTDRRYLKDAFRVVKTVQDSLYVSHQLGGLSG